MFMLNDGRLFEKSISLPEDKPLPEYTQETPDMIITDETFRLK